MKILIILINLIYFINCKLIQELNLNFLIDKNFYLTKYINNQNIHHTIDHLKSSLSNLATIQTNFHYDFNLDEDHEIENCKNETLIVSILPCKETIKLYNLIQDNCESTILLSLISPYCKRPTLQQGIAFPIITKETETYVSLLIDLKLSILKQWISINILYDASVDKNVLDLIQNGFDNLNEPDVYSSELKLFKINFDSIDHLVKLIDEDIIFDKFFVIANSQIVLKFLKKSQKLNLLVHPRRWIIILTDYPNEIDLFKLNSILYATDASIVLKEKSSKLEQYCEPIIDDCQLKLLMETFHHALKKVISNDDYNFNNNLKRKTKNRMLSEMRKYLDVTANFDKLKMQNQNTKQNILQTNNEFNGTKQTNSFINSFLQFDTLEEDLKNNFYCGKCEKFELKSFERKVVQNKFKKLKKKKDLKIIDKKIIYQHKYHIFSNKNNRHGKIYKDSLDLLNFDLKFKPKSSLDYEAQKIQLNNVFNTYKNIRIKRFVQEQEIVPKTDAKWSPYKGFLEQNDPVLINIGSLTGRHFRIGVVSQKPLINVELDEIGNCIVNGTTYELIMVLMEQLNFTYEWICSEKLEEEGIGFYDLINKKWTGLLGLIASNKIDIAANGFYRTQLRLNSSLFTFTKFYDEEIVKILVRKTKEDDEWLFLSPFTYDTWICIFISILFISFLLYIIHKNSKYYDYYEESDLDELFGYRNFFWYIFGAIVQQNSDYLPKASSSRVLIIFWWLFVIVITATYSGNLVALLTFPKIIQPIENINDLLNTYSIKWAVGQGSQIEEVLSTLKYGDLTKLKSKMQYLDFKKNRKQIFNSIANGYLGFIMPESEARYWISKEYKEQNWCEMFVAKDSVYRASLHLILPKNKPENLVKKINEQIYYFTRYGLTEYWRKQYETMPDDCMYPLIINAGDVKKIRVIHMKGSFYVLIHGLIISIFVLIIEYIYYYSIIKNKNKLKSMDYSDDNFSVSDISKKQNIFTNLLKLICCQAQNDSKIINPINKPKISPFTTDSNAYKNSNSIFNKSSILLNWTTNPPKFGGPFFESKTNENIKFSSNLHHRPKIHNNQYSVYNSQYSVIYSNLAQNYNKGKHIDSFLNNKKK